MIRRHESERRIMNRTFSVVSVIFLLSSLFVCEAYAERPSHIDRMKVTNTCSACHSAHGKKGTVALRNTVPDLCFDCHSMGGDVFSGASTEVYNAFQKRYRHPVTETAEYHSPGEVLADYDMSAPRHISCLDCHNPHRSEKNVPMKDVPGHTVQRGAKLKKAKNESDVCYRCHADSPNRPVSSPDTMEDFDSSNASYHPVDKSARGRSISLFPDLRGKKMVCTDCHDPHGSDYKSMLRYNYTDVEGAETTYAYELCYSCHRRESIIGDQSFKEHRRHIVFESTSCSTCHNAHGSRDHKNLIEFDAGIVRPNSVGMLHYSKTGNETNCYLNCHGIEHTEDGVVKEELLQQMKIK